MLGNIKEATLFWVLIPMKGSFSVAQRYCDNSSIHVLITQIIQKIDTTIADKGLIQASQRGIGAILSEENIYLRTYLWVAKTWLVIRAILGDNIDLKDLEIAHIFSMLLQFQYLNIPRFEKIYGLWKSKILQQIDSEMIAKLKLSRLIEAPKLRDLLRYLWVDRDLYSQI